MKYEREPKPKWKRKEFKPNPGFDLSDETERRKLAEIETNRDLDKPIEQLVCDVHAEAMDTTRSDIQNLIGVQKRLTSMMARVANSNNRVANHMLALTIAIAIMTAIMLYIMINDQPSVSDPTPPQSSPDRP